MNINRAFVVGLVRVFIFAFFGAFLPLVSGILAAPNFDVGKALAVAALVAGVTAGVKAVVDFLTKGVAPAPSVGVFPREVAP